MKLDSEGVNWGMGSVVVGTAIFGAPRFLAKTLENTWFSTKRCKIGAPQKRPFLPAPKSHPPVERHGDDGDDDDDDEHDDDGLITNDDGAVRWWYWLIVTPHPAAQGGGSQGIGKKTWLKHVSKKWQHGYQKVTETEKRWPTPFWRHVELWRKEHDAIRVGFWQNGFFVDVFLFLSRLQFFSRTSSPDLFPFIFVGKVPRKILQQNPPEHIHTIKPRHTPAEGLGQMMSPWWYLRRRWHWW